MTVATSAPRSDAVSQSRSKLSPPESRQITEPRPADPRAQVLQVRRQVGAGALLTALDEHEDTAVPTARYRQTVTAANVAYPSSAVPRP